MRAPTGNLIRHALTGAPPSPEGKAKKEALSLKPSPMGKGDRRKAVVDEVFHTQLLEITYV